MTDSFEQRITFDPELQVAEINLSALTLSTSAEVNALYDAIEEAIAQTSEPLWFFVINYSGFRIENDAWYAHHKRGKALNLAHSQGTVRFDVSEETRRQIERTAETEAFDPNLFADRDRAIARVAGMPSKRVAKVVYDLGFTAQDIAPRVTFDDKAEVMEIDLSGLTFRNSGEVAVLYDHLEERLEATGLRWFFLINMDSTRIFEEAWVAYAQRGKALNLKWSMGTVRYNTETEAEETIRMRAESQAFRPNVRDDRDAALARLDEIRREMA